MYVRASAQPTKTTAHASFEYTQIFSWLGCAGDIDIAVKQEHEMAKMFHLRLGRKESRTENTSTHSERASSSKGVAQLSLGPLATTSMSGTPPLGRAVPLPLEKVKIHMKKAGISNIPSTSSVDASSDVDITVTSGTDLGGGN